MVLSQLPLTIVCPSELIATDPTGLVCPIRELFSLPVWFQLYRSDTRVRYRYQCRYQAIHKSVPHQRANAHPHPTTASPDEPNATHSGFVVGGEEQGRLETSLCRVQGADGEG